MDSKNKRGISPVVASVFMILLVMVLASIIFLWARGFVGEQIDKFGTPIEDSCAKVDLSINMYDNELEVLNRGNVDVRNLNIKRIHEGNSEVTLFASQIDSGATARGFVNLEMEDGMTMPDEIIAYPVLVGNVQGNERNNVFTCLNAGIRIL